jgi:hypothetical protein
MVSDFTGPVVVISVVVMLDGKCQGLVQHDHTIPRVEPIERELSRWRVGQRALISAASVGHPGRVEQPRPCRGKRGVQAVLGQQPGDDERAVAQAGAPARPRLKIPPR